MNGQVGCQSGDSILSLLAPIAICLHWQWNAGPAQLLAFGSIGVELTCLCCKGFCPSLVTRLTQDGWDVMMISSAEGLPLSHPAMRMSAGVIKVSSEPMAIL